MSVRPSAISSPVEIGIAGLGRNGTFHLERLNLRLDCNASIACDLRAETASLAQSFGCRFSQDWQTLLADPAVELVLISTALQDRTQMAMQALAAGKHVVVDAPASITTVEADALVTASQSSDRLLAVAQPRRCDVDFQMALSASQSNTIGQLQAVKMIIWDYGLLEPSTDQIGDSKVPTTGCDAFVTLGAPYFDQLLKLVPDPVKTIFARTFPAAGNQGAALQALPDDGFLAVLEFQNGISAQIEVYTTSPTPLDLGWVLTGTGGGYHASQEFIRTPDAEIFSSPMNPPTPDWDRVYDDIVKHLRTDGTEVASNSTALATPSQARRVVQTLEAARTSADEGRIVTLG